MMAKKTWRKNVRNFKKQLKQAAEEYKVRVKFQRKYGYIGMRFTCRYYTLIDKETGSIGYKVYELQEAIPEYKIGSGSYPVNLAVINCKRLIIKWLNALDE